MNYDAVYNATVDSDEPAHVLADRFNVSERTIYRYRKGRHPCFYSRIVRERMDKIMAIVETHRGDRRAIIDACAKAGITRNQYHYARRTMLRNGQLTTEDWPTRPRCRIHNQHWRLLRAMVKAGASVTQVARCFDVTDYVATAAIREAWALIELEAK